MNDKKEELKSWIKKIGLTEKYFAQQYYVSSYVEPTEKDIDKFCEKFRGHIKRNTTPIETIELYLNFLFDMEEFKALNYVKPNYVMGDNFSQEFNKRMRKISTDINNQLKEKEDNAND